MDGLEDSVLHPLVAIALLYFQPQFFHHPSLQYNFQWDGLKACWGSNKLWILWYMIKERMTPIDWKLTDYFATRTLWLSNFGPLFNYFIMFFHPLQSFFFKKQSDFFPMLQRVLDGKLKQAISNCSFSPIISMDVPLLLTNKVHKKEKKLHFPERTELLLIIANLYL